MSSSPSSPTSATTTVLHTTELLELILLSLDTRTLLTRAARVSRRFRDTTRASLPLRRALFLAPVADRGPLLPLNPPGAATANRCAPGELPRGLVPVANELVARTFRLGRYDEPDEDHDGGYMPMVAMKWLDEVGEGVGEERWWRKDSGAGGGGGGGAAAAAGSAEDGGSNIVAATVTPTWRRMLISQPPPRRVEVLIYGTSMFQSVKAWVECEEGVTLGSLHDKCRELAYGRSWSKRTVGWFFEL
ncbi:uncharacterized protein BKCO1_1900095 [Diplodia corticola]|uniref:F-box domain-containing protein n=1 Tax=Diplodia corticola TaxID=236234 RepID=A0A1J9S3L9_9PEZI|nr:uncharacterized protein BKCO1_1900095 [Diplodia corticola]OJD35151.1 hypothetical protein BKCO1_1900095 [Diplodia corticola]